jgi:hypothetical protein
MARPIRIHVAGGWYHVTCRGTGRRLIYEGNSENMREVGAWAGGLTWPAVSAAISRLSGLTWRSVTTSRAIGADGS